jgi:hypothetical protein
MGVVQYVESKTHTINRAVSILTIATLPAKLGGYCVGVATSQSEKWLIYRSDYEKRQII